MPIQFRTPFLPPLLRPLAGALLVGILLAVALGGQAVAKEYVIGLQSDRSGITQNISPMADGFQDYIRLLNSEHALGSGNSFRVVEVDHGYSVPKAAESFERQKAEGALSIGLYGTPPTMAVLPKLNEFHMLGTAPGFGPAAARNGQKYPYLFPVAASYWSQAAAAVKFVMDQWKDPSRKPRIAYLHLDNPGGREPLVLFDALQKQLGFELKTWAVPPPGLEMGPQVLEIARQYKADWVITHFFGVAPSASIKEFTRVGFPRNRVVSFVWGAAEVDINNAGLKNAEGYYGLQFAGVGQNYDVLKKIRAMYKAEGAAEPKAMEISVYYNRGVLAAALHARAIQLAIAKNGADITSQQVADAMQSINDFSLGGLLPPLTLTPQDHEGGGWVQMYQVQNGKWTPVTDWYRAYPELLEKFVYGQG